jgi:ribonuclease HI
MSTESSVYLGFTDGASRHTQNLASVAWVIYSPEGQLVSSGGICLGPSTNNVVEYSIIIEILRDTISHGVHSLEVRLDSQLVVCQLNDSYHV